MILISHTFMAAAGLACVILVSTGCQKKTPVAPNTAQTSQQSSTSDGPSITPLPDAAEWAHNAMGFVDVIAYEFAGTQLACWLECEVDGEQAARATEIRVAFADCDDAKNVRGWITLGGSEHSSLKLWVRGQFVKGKRTAYYGSILPYELEIPRRDDAQFKLGSGGLDAGWTGSLELPDKADEEFVIHSYEWEEQETADGPIVRRVRVMLKGKRLPLRNTEDAPADTL